MRQLALLLPFLFLWGIVAFVVESLGGNSLAAMLITGLVAAIALNPLVFKASNFRCGECGRVSAPSEVTSRGWDLRL